PATRPAARPRRPSAPPAPAAAWSSSPTGRSPASRHVRHRERALQPARVGTFGRANATFGAPGGPASPTPDVTFARPYVPTRGNTGSAVSSHTGGAACGDVPVGIP